MLQNNAQNIGDADDTCHFVVRVGDIQAMNSILAHVFNNGLEGHISLDGDWFDGGLW